MSGRNRSTAVTAASSLAAVLDPDISTLAAVLDTEELGKQLRGLPLSQRWEALQDVQIKVLRRHSAKRCTFEIVLRTGLVGKVYAKDRQDVYQAMQGISEAGFGSEAEFSIPEPVAYLPSLRLLLQERVEGMPARLIFRFGDEPQRAAAAERCARWLARFHALAPPSGPILNVEEILRRSERKRDLVSKEGGALAAKSERLFERLRAAAAALGTIPLCAGHGDYCSNQVILAERRTVVVDWDICNIADPSHDVARFIIGLERQGLKELGSIGALDGAAEVFLKTYLASGGGPQVAAHLPFYKAVCYLRGVTWDVKKKGFRWRERAEAMLDEGLRTLQQPYHGRRANVRTAPQLR